jgi:beta-lactamase class A
VGLLICFTCRAASGAEAIENALKAVETRIGGRVGVAALDAASDRQVLYRADERFAMCSTFKVLLAAAVLHRVERSEEQLTRVIRYSAADIQSHAPVTKENLHDGKGEMTVEALCDAIIRYSDNTAANLLLDTMGGPAGLTSYARSLGDDVTRLDRKEEELNTAIPGDERDTTSPAAMLHSLRAVLLGAALTPASREKLEGWMVGNTTGAKMIRAGLPDGWQVGDKTGRGANSATNDIAIIRPPGRAPILLCIYTAEGRAELAEREKAIADVATAVAQEFPR